MKDILSIRDIYDEKVIERTNIKQQTKDPQELLYFKEIKEITDEMDIPESIYIEAQFHGLSWTDSFPTPKQLVGEKAIQRLQKYMFEKKIKVKDNEKTTVKVSLVDKLKQLKNDKD